MADISWRSLILAAERERTVDKLDRNIVCVVAFELIDRTLIDIEGIEYTLEGEIGKYRDVNNVSDYLLIDMLFQGEHIAEPGRLQHRNQILGEDYLQEIEKL